MTLRRSSSGIAHKTAEESPDDAIEQIEDEEVNRDPDERKYQFTEHQLPLYHRIIVLNGSAVGPLNLFKEFFEVVRIVDKINVGGFDDK